MTKKHFNAMAAEFKTTHENARNMEERIGVAAAVLAFCNVAEDFNPRFDRHRFMVACGLEG